MYIDFILQQFTNFSNQIALITDNKDITYLDLYNKYNYWKKYLDDKNIKNTVVAVVGEFDCNTIGLMLAIIENENVYVPISYSIKNPERYFEISQTKYFIDPYENKVEEFNREVNHEILLEIINNRKNPGLILFSSGTTGEPKAAVHDLVPMLKKYNMPGKKIKSIAFLLFDHIGGFNTVMHNISNGGTMITVKERSADEVCKAIEKYKVEVLPTSPSFINMILYSRIYEKYDIASLRLVTYGTEPMPEATLIAFNNLFPNICLKQTYGLSELGIMRTQSENSHSLWIKLGDDTHKIDIREGILWIKTEMAMLGYLNAESPFDNNGWFNTKDKVEVKGEYIKILGRESEVINIGGEKVYPAEVESIILEVDGVKDVVVSSEKNPVLGNIVVAKVVLQEDLDEKEYKKNIKKHCARNLEKYKIPVKMYFQKNDFVTNRFKKKR